MLKHFAVSVNHTAIYLGVGRGGEVLIMEALNTHLEVIF